MKYKWLAVLAVIVVIILIAGYLLGFFGQTINLGFVNHKPVVAITYPADSATVFNLVMVSGTASDPDANDVVLKVEVKIGEGAWVLAQGTAQWSYDWTTYSFSDGSYSLSARSWDGELYSDVNTISVTLHNPTAVESGSHKWAVFIAAANFPANNSSKLGNGGLFLAENMASYFIEKRNFSTSNTFILFDDGWFRSGNGYGKKLETLQQRPHDLSITYGAATKTNVLLTLGHVINESNQFTDSEVFLWIFDHGYGNLKSPFGGKLFQHSIIFLWNDTLTDKELGGMLSPLKSKKVAILIDACYAGGFADRSALNFQTSLFLRSGIPGGGRVVISSTSKFQPGYASTTQGPLFSYLWFEGIKTVDADGFRPGLLNLGVPKHLKFFKDGVVSVEEAFYYAKYILRTDATLRNYSAMHPQINDEYPHRGFFLNNGQLIL
ncbi:MAG TPA: Ig-like domain-containing protein [Candidatus Thermoplasmatota archaeon]|nr:Ig-like domain-containing protein [Candidatus Thermoplasmatota archaeon]